LWKNKKKTNWMDSNEDVKAIKPVRVWLLIGLTMIFFQVVLGGITRLTGSGLSITKWDIVTGAIPPMTQKAWEEEYQLYQQTPQFAKINKEMDLGAFKRIYFWEFTHRLWARSMGFVFIFPLIYFLRKRWISPSLKKDLLIVFLLAALVASFGWIMVASGLVDRPWVNAYKLTVHLGLGILLFEFLFVTYLKVSGIRSRVTASPFGKGSRYVPWLLGIVIFQILLGGLMSGMKAGFAFPTFPKLNGEWFPSVLFDASNWTLQNMKDYDGHLFAPALIQVLHRLTAYLIVFVGGTFVYKVKQGRCNSLCKRVISVFVGLVSLQILLGVYTVLGCKYGAVPLALGVLHQSVGLLTLSSVVLIWFLNSYGNSRNMGASSL